MPHLDHLKNLEKTDELVVKLYALGAMRDELLLHAT